MLPSEFDVAVELALALDVLPSEFDVAVELALALDVLPSEFDVAVELALALDNSTSFLWLVLFELILAAPNPPIAIVAAIINVLSIFLFIITFPPKSLPL